MQNAVIWHHQGFMDAAHAAQIATDAHRGQTDKAGNDYINHPARVAERVARLHGDDHPGVVVAWLHDVIEDTTVSLDDLRQAGLDDQQAEALDVLTHRRGEQRADYMTRIARNELACIVKHADIDDNTDPERLAVLDDDTRRRLETKYARDRATLAGATAASG